MSGQSQSGESQTMAIKMPQNGTIVKTSGMEGSVAAGSPIAYAYNLDDLYITANIDEKMLAV